MISPAVFLFVAMFFWEECGLAQQITTIKMDGGRLDWSPKLNLIAFDKRGEDGYYDVYIMNPDGTGERCLTNKPDLVPQKHNGQPAWHSSGEYIVFQAEKAFNPGISGLATPGIGINCDLWVMTRDGARFWRLIDTPLKSPAGAVLHPHFSYDGQKLLWAERIGEGGNWGEWALKVADFVIRDSVPGLENIKTYQPGKQHLFYESHGFTPDGKKIIFSGNLEPGQDEVYLDIYTLDLGTEKLERLTSTMDEWDEHAQYSPNGRKIVWMSSHGYKFNIPNIKLWWDNELKTDYWIMNSDGSDKKRLTYFNEPGHPEYRGERVVCADCSWNADGTKLAALIMVGKRSEIVIIENKKTVESIKKISEGIYPKWSKAKNLIAFNKIINGSFEIFTMKPDGSDVKCLTSNKPSLPNSNKGQPYWHPNGEYIVFTAENINHKRTGMGLGLAEMPGIGRNHNVWIMKSDGSQFWQLTDYLENWGVFRPSFSHNGRRLYWNEEYSMEKYPGIGSSWKWPRSFVPWLRDNPKGEEWGLIRIKIADISFKANGPKTSNIRNIVHPGLTLLEGSGFTPDDKGFIFTSANTSETEGSAYWGGDIYTSDLKGGSIIRLTNTPYEHDENMEYSPDSKKIVWTQAKGSPGDKQDMYIMDRDGKNKTRLTYFNEPGHPEYIPDALGGCGEMDWSPDGKNIIFAFGMGKQPEYPYLKYDLFMLTFEGGL